MPPLPKVRAAIAGGNGYSVCLCTKIESITSGSTLCQDLLPYLSEDDDFDWNRLMRGLSLCTKTKKIDSLLKAFKEEKIHMVIVVDEFGGTQWASHYGGDILEEIVGRLRMSTTPMRRRLFVETTDGSFIFDAKIGVIDFLRTVKISDFREIEEEMDEVDTLGGMLLEVKFDFPVVGRKSISVSAASWYSRWAKRRVSKVQFFPDHETIEEE